MIRVILIELKRHAPFTVLGTISGIVIMVALSVGHVPHDVSEVFFWGLHPIHVLLSALVTTAIYRIHSRGALLQTIVVGYVGSIGIATASDCLIPFVGEWLLHLPNRGLHLGFIEKWWLVNPMAFIGIGIGYVWHRTRFPHAGHVLLSTWASLFHMSMAMGDAITPLTYGIVAVFLFLAVWVPCCTSDIIFPLLWTGGEEKRGP